MDNKAYDIAIIGGGAAGLAAGISALEKAPGSRVLIIEKKDAAGRKICATGNGRCNLTNTACEGYIETLKFFDRAGVITRTKEGGRVYPYSGDAKDVRDALTARFLELGGRIETDAQVTEVMPITVNARESRDDEIKGARGYIILTSGGDKTRAGMVLVATGGKASPKHGSTGDGYKLARMLGHSVTKLAPSLTAVETKEDVSGIAGVRAEAFVTLKENGEVKAGERGEVQFTKYGLSGICVFDMTRHMEIPEGRSLENGLDDYTIELDLIPDIKDARTFLKGRTDMGADILRSVVKAGLAEYIMERTGRDDIGGLEDALKGLAFHPAKLKGWEFAQVTKGGVPYYEINAETMESRVCKGLYFAGEILDYDGPCGGFNLQHAWETGMRAGAAMGTALLEMKNE